MFCRRIEITSRHHIEYVLREGDVDDKLRSVKSFIHHLDQKEVTYKLQEDPLLNLEMLKHSCFDGFYELRIDGIVGRTCQRDQRP